MLIRVCCPFSVKADIDEQALAEARRLSLAKIAKRSSPPRRSQFEETPTVVAREGTPHVKACAYLYDVAGLLRLYEHRPIRQRRE